MFLQKGANTHLKNTKDPVKVQLDWEDSQMTITPYCLLIDHDEKLNMFFEKQNVDFLSVLNKSEQIMQYQLNLKEVPANIKKIVFACIIHGSQPNRKIGISIATGNQNIHFEFNATSKNRALIIGEVYRYNMEWKVRAVGQEVNGDKKELLNYYQDRKPGDEGNSQKAFPKIVTVLDFSAYSLEYFKSGQLEKLFRDVYIASSTINPARVMDVWFYAVSHQKTVVATDKNFQTYIQDFQPRKNFFNGLGLENQELPLIHDLLREYENTETIIFFICNGKFHNSETVFKLINYSSNNILWEFIILNKDLQWGSKDNTKNIKFLPLSGLIDLNKGKLHQRLLRPIDLWKNR